MATTTGYRHGVYTREVPTSLLPARSVDSAVVFAVGTAAVHKLGSDAKVPVNEPMLFYSYDEFVTAMGWDADNFSDYTLQELVYSHFALYRGAPIIAVNVFDPGRHRSEVSGESLKDSQADFDQNNMPVVTTSFDAAGARRFAKLTTEHVGERFAIVLDGKVLSAPTIREPIPGGRGQISGGFNLQGAKDLAVLLRSGALPAPLSVIEERTVGAGLGADTIAAGKIGSAVGVLFVMIFMIVFYRRFGVIADIVLLVNLAMIIGVSALFGATLTLPGIAGIVLTLGMAVDANILPFERIRDEVRAGSPTLRAVDNGFHRSTKTVMDGNLTNLICSLILFQFGAGPIRGFAVTLSIGVATTLFTCLLLSRVLIDFYMDGRNKKIGFIKE